MTSKELGQLIVERRAALSLTQRMLAEYTNISLVNLSKIESGKANPTLKTMNEILSFLGMEIIIEPKKR